MKNRFLPLFIGLLAGCDQGVILTDTWACPTGTVFKSWKDGYPGEEKKFVAYGCRDSEGNRVGFHIAWKMYGVKEHEGSFENDKPMGEWSYYHENGNLASRGFFVNGKRDGAWLYWHENGDFKQEKIYDLGRETTD